MSQRRWQAVSSRPEPALQLRIGGMGRGCHRYRLRLNHQTLAPLPARLIENQEQFGCSPVLLTIS